MSRMCDGDFRFEQHQRARGALSLAFRRRGPISCLADLRQEGCLKARFPRPDGGMQVVTLNTSGGIAGGPVVLGAVRGRGDR